MIRSSAHSSSSSSHDAYDASAGHVCPFCGLTREISAAFDPASPCPRCTLSDTPQTRNATKLRVGPWHVRQVRNPWAPGMRFETLLALVKRGQVTRDSIVRGPTTFQLWRRAGEIRGLSREFGLCYSCAGELDAQANLCPHCNRSQEPPANPDALIESREVAPPLASVKPAAPSPDDPPSIDIASSTPRPSAGDDPADLLAVTEQPEAMPIAPPVRPIVSQQPKSQRDEKSSAKPQAAASPVEEPKVPAAPENPAEEEVSDEKPAAEKERPIPIRPRTPGADDALLTPQELAAAFQLDFSPTSSERRGGSKLAATLLVLLLLAGGAAALLYLRPDFRQRALAWTERTWSSARQFVTSRTSPPATKPPASASRMTPTSRPGSLVMDRPVGPLPATRPRPIVVAPPPAPGPDSELEAMKAADATPESPPTPSASSAPTSAPAPAVATSSPTEPKIVETPIPPRPQATELAEADSPRTAATDEAMTAVRTRPAPQAPPDAPAPAPPVVPPPSPRPAPPAAAQSPRPSSPPQAKAPDVSEVYAEARRLLGKALDAEENQDYVEAVRCYEAIKRLPVDARAMGIDVRLQRARKLVQ